MNGNGSKINGEDCCERTTVRGEMLKKTLVSRLNRIEGQIRGVRGMVERDVYCDDVLNQIAAAQSALSSVAKLVLEHHIRSCVADRIKDGDEGMVDELIVTIGRLL